MNKVISSKAIVSLLKSRALLATVTHSNPTYPSLQLCTILLLQIRSAQGLVMLGDFIQPSTIRAQMTSSCLYSSYFNTYI